MISTGKTTWTDGALLGDWLDEHRPQRALVELIHFWPGMPNASGAAVLCRVAGGIETMLSSLAIPFEHVQPAAWKRRAGLLKKDKSASMALAKARLSWPEGGCYLAKHHGRAEAALIALYGRAPLAPPKAPKRSKIVDRVAAECLPVGPLFRSA
jgi:hypothetical protein